MAHQSFRGYGTFDVITKTIKDGMTMLVLRVNLYMNLIRT